MVRNIRRLGDRKSPISQKKFYDTLRFKMDFTPLRPQIESLST